MIDPDQIERMRCMWVAILHQAVENYRRRCAAARRGEKYAATTNGSLREHRIRPIDAELADARAYFTSADGREVAENAGMSINLDKLLHYIATSDKAISGGDLA